MHEDGVPHRQHNWKGRRSMKNRNVTRKIVAAGTATALVVGGISPASADPMNSSRPYSAADWAMRGFQMLGNPATIQFGANHLLSSAPSVLSYDSLLVANQAFFNAVRFLTP